MTEKKHGGKRPNSGRKPGTGKGRKVSYKTITLPLELWGKLDSIRGKLSRSEWFASKIRRAKCPINVQVDGSPSQDSNEAPR